MKHNIIGIRREDLSKISEKRVALTPEKVGELIALGHKFCIQPAFHPEKQVQKRTFQDAEYAEAGAFITEDLSESKVIFGLKEIELPYILPEKAYYLFSHTHKGQKKNRKMLRTFVEQKATVIDYELITNAKHQRLVTAFTYYAGYAGMIDSLWALGKRLNAEGLSTLFDQIPQSVEKEDLPYIKELLRELGKKIKAEGTPKELPPVIVLFSGNGKTSHGAQEILDCLPVETITPAQLKTIYQFGDRRKIYKLVLEIRDMYRLDADTSDTVIYTYNELQGEAKDEFYKTYPEYFESNMDAFFPYCMVWMNCILWGPKYPRLITRENAAKWYEEHKTLRVIGDISCDPDGAVQFSRDTWIDNPVFTYHPETDSETMGYAAKGIAVMAVTNLPCEFPADASQAFCQDLSPFFTQIAAADYEAEKAQYSGLPDEILRAIILWKGKFTPEFRYMEAYLEEALAQ